MDAKSRALELLFTPGEWFQFPRRLLKKLKPNQCLLFACLAGYASRYKNEDGWFFRTVQDVEDDICMSEDQQWRNLQELKKLGLIDAERRGMPAVRYFRINWEQVCRVLSDDGQEPAKVRAPDQTPQSPRENAGQGRDIAASDSAPVRDLTPQNCGRKKTEREEGVNKRIQPPCGGGPTGGFIVAPKKEETPAEEWAGKASVALIDGLSQKLMSPPNPAKWKDVLAKFVEKNWEHRDRIFTTLVWFSKHFRDPFVPKVRSAAAFVERYDDIEAAMERAAKEPNKPGNNGHDALPKYIHDIPVADCRREDGTIDIDGLLCFVYGQRHKTFVVRPHNIPRPEREALVAEFRAKGIIT